MAQELMSGLNAPVSHSWRWCGWRVLQPIDILFGEEYDLEKTSLQKKVKEQEVDARFVGIECSTTSRIREIPMHGGQKSPEASEERRVPGRQASEPDGKDGISPEQNERVPEVRHRRREK